MAGRTSIAKLDDVEPLRVWEGVIRRALRDHFEIEAFGVNAYTAPTPGVHVVEPHDHRGGSAGAQEELYIVLSGHATFSLDDEEVEAPAGSFVFVEPEVARSAVAREPNTTVVAFGAPPGRPYDPPPWPAAAAMWRYREYVAAGELDAALAYLDEVLDRFPENPGVLYQRALCNAALGRPEQATADLRRAVAGDARLARIARDDDGFATLRGRDSFEQVVGTA